MATQSNKEVFLGGFKKLLDEQWQPDIRLKGGDSDESAAIFAHKLVLVARSEVFKDLLEQDGFKADKLVETVTLWEMKHEEVEALVEFIYSGSISSEGLKKHARSLYLAADKYDIPHLRDLCRNELISSLSSSNVLSILELAQIPFDKALNDAAFNNVIANMSTRIASSDEQWQPDIRLKGGDSDESAAIFAHKLVLVARSKLFKMILESDEFKAPVKLVETITLWEMKHEEVEALVEFIYSVDGSISSEGLKKHARSLYLAADKYEIPHLRDICRNKLISSLSPLNAPSIRELAQIPFDKALYDACTDIIINHEIIMYYRSDEFNLLLSQTIDA